MNKLKTENDDIKQLNQMRKKFFSTREKLDKETVLAAISGDTIALMEIVNIYEPYINKLSKRITIDEYGQYTEKVNEIVKQTLTTSLISAIMKFNPYKK